jgi:outer membrane protein
MNRFLMCVLFAALLVPVLGIAQTSTPASATVSSVKIAWVNMEPAILTCEEGKKEFSTIQKYIEEKNSDLEKLKNDVDKLKNQLSVQSGKLTDEARAELEDSAEAKETALQRFQQDTQKDIENRKGRIVNFLARKMQPVIEKVAKEKGLSAVFYFSSNRDAWVDPALNITEDIVKAYNLMYPADAAKPPAAKNP